MASLVTTSLGEAERRVLERFVGSLTDEYGQDLHAVWLYGSRARGEAPHEDSDIDLIVVTTGGGKRDDTRVRELREAAAEAEGMEPWSISVFVFDPEHVAQRRAIESFFMQEVDRDKIVLAGGEVPPPEGSTWDEPEDGRVKPRTQEFLDGAHQRLGLARTALDSEYAGLAVSPAYYAMLYAARAALSEQNLHAKTHSGVWTLFSQHFVRPGKIAQPLHKATQVAQEQRWAADYGAARIEPRAAEATVAAAAELIESVERLLLLT